MNAAYAKWQTEEARKENWTQSELFERCSDEEIWACLLGNFNYQVGNGGVTQYVDNGYGLLIERLLTVLDRVGHDVAARVKTMLEPLVEYIDFDVGDRGFSNYWILDNDQPMWDDDDEEEEDNPGQELASDINDRLYLGEYDKCLMVRLETVVKEWFDEGCPDRTGQAYPDASKSEPSKVKPKLNLTGVDSNAYMLLAAAKRAARKAKWDTARAEAVIAEAKEGDYDHLIQTLMKHFDVS